MRVIFIALLMVLVGCASQPKVENNKITVVGVGRTFDEAKQNGFQKAVEKVIGTVILTETQVTNNQLVKDEIIQHSAGYVDDFTIINRNIENGKNYVTMEVTVRSSKIAERVLGVQSNTGEFQGSRLAAQHQSYIRDRLEGDKFLTKILNDYPKYAFVVKRGKVEFKLNREREPVILIPVQITWNQKYLEGLREALTLTHDGKNNTVRQDRIIISSKKSDDRYGSRDIFYFSDKVRADIIKSYLIQPIYTIVNLKDSYNRVIASMCDNGSYVNGTNLEYNPFTIRGSDIIADNIINITVGNMQTKQQLERITEVEVIVDNKPCNL